MDNVEMIPAIVVRYPCGCVDLVYKSGTKIALHVHESDCKIYYSMTDEVTKRAATQLG